MTEIWNSFLVHPLINLLMAAYGIVGDFGLAIVLVTVGIRLVMYPLFVQQIRSQRAMQEVAPALAELKQKYGKDRQKMAEEQMKLYKERGVSPAAGCLPLLLQMPILFAFYAALLQLTYGLGAGFGGQIDPLTGAQFETIRYPFIPNPLESGEGLDLHANWLPWLPQGLGATDPLFILPVLAGVTQLVASLMAQPAQAPKVLDPQARMMQSMVYYFPVITVVIAIGLPAGLAVYWVATTLFQIAQQYFVSGWGRLPRWVPILRAVPSPADRTLKREQREVVQEMEQDMVGAPKAPEAARGADGEGEAEPRDEGRRRGRRRRRR